MKMRSTTSAFAAALFLVGTACSSDAPSTTGPDLFSGTLTSDILADGDATIQVCKTSFQDVFPELFPENPPDLTLGESFDFNISANGGNVIPANGDFSLVAGTWNDVNFGTGQAENTVHCEVVWTNIGDTENDMITISEILPEGTFLKSVSVRYLDDVDNFGQQYGPEDDPEITFAARVGTRIFFKNMVVEPPPPPPTSQGCTPGYWRQVHHYGNWVNYAPSDLFDDVFGVSYDSDLELGDAVQLNGGQEKALFRHAVAALLNAASPLVDYPFTEGEIIASTAAAFNSGDNGIMESLKNEFADANEAGCDLGRAELPEDESGDGADEGNNGNKGKAKKK